VTSADRILRIVSLELIVRACESFDDAFAILSAS
jgi:hypothetical protein